MIRAIRRSSMTGISAFPARTCDSLRFSPIISDPAGSFEFIVFLIFFFLLSASSSSSSSFCSASFFGKDGEENPELRIRTDVFAVGLRALSSEEPEELRTGTFVLSTGEGASRSTTAASQIGRKGSRLVIVQFRLFASQGPGNQGWCWTSGNRARPKKSGESFVRGRAKKIHMQACTSAGRLRVRPAILQTIGPRTTVQA